MFTAGSCYAQLMDLQATAGPGTVFGIRIVMLWAIAVLYPAIWWVSEGVTREDLKNAHTP